MSQEQITLSNGTTLVVNKWGVLKTLNKAPLFGKTIGIPMAQLYSNGAEGIQEVLTDALFLLFTNLEEVSPETLVRNLLEGTYVQINGQGTPQPVDPDKHFTELGVLIEACAKVFKVHYGSLFSKEGLGGLSSMAAGMSGLKE